MQTVQVIGGSTFVWLIGRASTSSTSGSYFLIRGDTGQHIGFQQKGASGETFVNLGSSAIGPVLNDGQLHCIAARVISRVNGGIGIGGTAFIHIDGIQLASANIGTFFPWAANPIRWAISQDSFWNRFNGQLGPTYWWNRALSAGEIEQISINPYIFYLQPNTRRFFSPPGPTAPIATPAAQMASLF